MSYKKNNQSRKKIKGTEKRLRLSVYKSNNNLFAQIIDDIAGKTIAAASSVKNKATINIKIAGEIGESMAKKASEKSIKDVVFDRGKYQYKGIIKAFAESARKSGLNF